MQNQEKQQLLAFWKETGIIWDDLIITAYNMIPREVFVLPENIGKAYQDTPLPILRGKTISQPTTVLLMTQALQIQPGDKIMEVGTGSGYQTALLAFLAGEKGHVYSAEILPELIEFAKNNLAGAGISNVTVVEQDGSRGMPEHAPFDKIILTAAATDFPDALVEQLKPEGLIIGPIGDRNEQEMVLGRKVGNRLELDFLGQFLFSAMDGKYGFDD